MARLWGILRKKQKIVRDAVVDMDGEQAGLLAAVDEICHKLDIPRPIFMEKHDKEMEQFGRAIFLPDHFIESVQFDRFEIELLREKGRSSDPRNDFSSL